jgi:demethylmenaquinone methyltransferase/2-methoxy-6-polyprenyl-1,4-benzoquinol methylase
LKPNSPLLVLEFSQPENPVIRSLYKFYSFNILPLIGRIVSHDSTAYQYLPESVSKFPSGKKFEEVMIRCGFTDTKIIPLTFGISTLYIGIAKK